MGHCDSSAQHGSDGEVFAARRGIAETVAAHHHAAVGHPQLHPFRANLKYSGAWLLLALVRCYQVFLGPFLGGACKFHPSCSNYAYQAIARHGARRGLVLAMKRLGRCRPFTRGGFDPVPDALEPDAPALTVPHSFVTQGKAQ